LLEFKTRKNSKVPRKFFEEYLVRFPDLALDTLAESMMSGCLDAKSPYQQTECCELISAVLRRFKTLSVPSQAVLFDKFSVFLHSLAQSAQALVTTRVATGEGSGNGNGSSVIVAGKRLKVFLGCIKDVLVIIKQKVKLSGEVAEVSPALVASLALLRDLVDAKGLISAHLQSDLKNGLNASLNVLCQQSKQLVDELGPLKTKEKKEEERKRKENASTGNHQDGEVVFKQKKVKKSKQ